MIQLGIANYDTLAIRAAVLGNVKIVQLMVGLGVKNYEAIKSATGHFVTMTGNREKKKQFKHSLFFLKKIFHICNWENKQTNKS